MCFLSSEVPWMPLSSIFFINVLKFDGRLLIYRRRYFTLNLPDLHVHYEIG